MTASEEVIQLPQGVEYLIQKFKVALLTMEALGQQPVDCAVAMRAHTSACSLHPLFSSHIQHVSYDLELHDEDLTEETWEWLSKLQLRRLVVQQGGLARLRRALPATPFQHLASLSVATSQDGHLNKVLAQLESLRHLEVSLSGAGATFPKLPHHLDSLAIHCSNTASLHTLVSLCKADRVTVTANEDIIWNTSIAAGLEGVENAAGLLDVANGRYTGGTAFAGLRLLMPTGFHRMFGSMSLPDAITSAGTLHCYAAAVAAQVAALPPFQLTLCVKQAMLVQDHSGPLPSSALNFSPNLPNSAAVWEALWEGAGILSGLQLHYSFITLEASEGGGIQATVQKTSPAKEWPKPAPAGAGSAQRHQQQQAAGAGEGTQQQAQQQRRRGPSGVAKHRGSIKWRADRRGHALQLVQGLVFLGAGMLLQRLLMRSRTA